MYARFYTHMGHSFEWFVKNACELKLKNSKNTLSQVFGMTSENVVKELLQTVWKTLTLGSCVHWNKYSTVQD